jgi:hypothetical protein
MSVLMTQDVLQQYAFEEGVVLGWDAAPDLRSLSLKAEVMRTFLHPTLAGKDRHTIPREDLYVVVDVEFYGIILCRYCVSSAIGHSGQEDDYGSIDVFAEVPQSELLEQLQLPGDLVPGTALRYPTAQGSDLHHFLLRSDYLDLEVVCEGFRVVQRGRNKVQQSPKKRAPRG